MIGIVIGGLISRVTAGVSGLSWLSYGNTFGINSNGNPLVLDLGILDLLHFALQIKITVLKYYWRDSCHLGFTDSSDYPLVRKG